jgi:hypothetical protein
MERKGYYLKPGTRGTAPRVLFSLVINPALADGGASSRDQFHTFASADVCCSVYRRGKWSAPRSAHVNSERELSAWMGAQAQPRARNYVVTPSAAESLALGGTWEEIDSGPVKWLPPNAVRKNAQKRTAHKNLTIVRRACLSPRCTILDFTRAGLRWVWMSGTQFFTSSEDELADSFGHGWADTGRTDAPGLWTNRTGPERAALWLTAFQGLSDWWRENSKAPFALTASGLALGILRTHIKPKALCTHTHATTHALEREACFGGRATTWFYGDVGQLSLHRGRNPEPPPKSQYGAIPGPLAHVDVRSMYPALLRDREYPRQFITYRENVPASEPAEYAHSHGVIARVTIETDTPEYPCRVGSRIFYPTGQFTTTLTGPEILALRGEGRIRKCHAMSVYMLGRPFREAAGALLDMRARAQADGRASWEMLAKNIATALGGKLAQRKGAWVDRPKIDAPLRFGEWFGAAARSSSVHRFRALAGLVWEYQPDASGSGPYTAAFAYLAAYGRLMMKGVRHACPQESIVSQDTDGIWATEDAMEALHVGGLLGACGPGSLRITHAVTAARFFGPRHYWTPEAWTLAGFHNPTLNADATRVADTLRCVPTSGPAGAPPRGVCVRARSSALAIESPGLKIGPNGWATARPRRGMLS